MIALMHAQGLDEPWSSHSFIDEITHLQRIRLLHSSCAPCEVQFHDRSIFCTAALSDYLGRPRSLVLSQELERVVAQQFYQPEAFFIRGLGFI
jgi:predicted ATPase